MRSLKLGGILIILAVILTLGLIQSIVDHVTMETTKELVK